MLLLSNDRSTYTHLQTAVEESHSDVVEILLQHGVKVDERRNVWDSTILHLTAMTRHARVVKVLVRNGVDLNTRYDSLTELP
jgi:ankyrin repeat protein